MRWTGVAAVVVLWSTQLVAICFAGFDLAGERPLSYLANEPGTGWLFSLGLVVAAVLFLAFLSYLRRSYPVGLGFTVVMTVGMVSQLVAGVLPIGGDGAVSRAHVISALVLGASIPVLMGCFAADQAAGPWRRRCWQLFGVEAAACAVGIVLSQLHVAPIAEILPAMAFHLWVVVVTLDGGVAVRDAPAGQASTVSRVARMSSP
ncbi:DUF998 domain-containing protein [Aquihabitans daechungensis]|uniref:DUF998 domain-containing protein n=1 Tax=Aquihabitans daechungensis TaxID=1052257 RepID=UPI003B9DD304